MAVACAGNDSDTDDIGIGAAFGASDVAVEVGGTDRTAAGVAETVATAPTVATFCSGAGLRAPCKAQGGANNATPDTTRAASSVKRHSGDPRHTWARPC